MKDILLSAGYRTRSYSGRGMYGKQCLGVVTDDDLITLVVNIFKQSLDMEYSTEVYDLLETLLNTKQDNMGLSTIYYWPSVEWSEE